MPGFQYYLGKGKRNDRTKPVKTDKASTARTFYFTYDQYRDRWDDIAAAQIPNKKTALQRQINTTDNQIDKLVYELYDLTDDEIKIVEDATQK